MTEAPTPDLPRGAGGPSVRRVAGRDPCLFASISRAATGRGPHSSYCGPQAAAVVLEPDPLVRLLVVPAVAALGFTVAVRPDVDARGVRVEAVFIPLDRQEDCRRASEAARGDGRAGGRPPAVVGYGTGPPLLLAAHRAHSCADVVVRLAAVDGRPCLLHLPAADVVTAAGLTPREADVLVLLLDGLTTAAIAERLCVSANTARSHCRAVLRKTAAHDRRTLRARLLAGAADLPSAASSAVLPRFA